VVKPVDERTAADAAEI
jgi:hypothetical protein